MRTPIVLLGLAALALGCWLWWSSDDAVQAPAPDQSATSGPSEATAAASADVAAAETKRHEATPAPASEPATPAPQPEADDSSPIRVDPWLARLLVVDVRDEPVGDAVVTIWAGTRVRASAFARTTAGAGNAYSGHSDEVLHELRTDANGRAQVTLGIECAYTEANKDGVGRSGELTLSPQTTAARETKLRLESSLRLQGIVLRADGQPAANATVTATVNGYSTARPGITSSTPEPATTAADGRFTLVVEQQSGYGVVAELDGTRSFPEHVWIHERSLEVTLTFPGGITIGGIVVDTEGTPVAGANVRTWREVRERAPDDPRDGVDDSESTEAKTGSDGRFSMPVRKHARYMVVASKDGYAHSQSHWVESTPVRPHTDARLQLLTLATIRGRVERGDGTPFAGASVHALPESGAEVAGLNRPSSRDLFPPVRPVPTGDDGTFELPVHPTTTWTVVVRPSGDRRVSKEKSGVQPGSEDVVVRISDAELAGCIVHGTVCTLDGQPLPTFEVHVVSRDSRGRRGSRDAKAIIEGDRFELPPLSLGRQYSLRVVPPRGGDAFAPTEVGPFTTDQPELRFDVVLRPWGEVPVRVLEASGARVRRARVAIQSAVHAGFFYSPLETDAEGCVALKRCVPGDNTLRVYDNSKQLHEQPLLVTPGLNPEVVVRLPAGK